MGWMARGCGRVSSWENIVGTLAIGAPGPIELFLRSRRAR